jgi:hypothetical protein
MVRDKRIRGFRGEERTYPSLLPNGERKVLEFFIFCSKGP